MSYMKNGEEGEDGILNTDGEFEPPNVLSVNVEGNIVITRSGVIQGPYTHTEWLEYSEKLWLLQNQV